MPTAEELRIMQAYPLDLKVKKTQLRICEWVNYYGVENCAVAFSGGKVIGSFVCDRIREIIPLGLRGFKLGAEWLKEMCLSKEQLDEYGGLKTLYSWHITAPKLFDKPKELSEFGIARAPMSWCYVEELQ